MKIKNISQDNFTIPSNLIKDSTGAFHRDLVLTPGQIVYLETTLRPNAFIVWARKKYIEITDDPKPAAVEYCKAYSTLKSAQIKTTIVDMDDDDDDDSGIEEIPMAIVEVPAMEEVEEEEDDYTADAMDKEASMDDDENDDDAANDAANDAVNDLSAEPVVIKNKGGRPKGVKNKKKKKNKKNKSQKTKSVQANSDLPSSNPSDSQN